MRSRIPRQEWQRVAHSVRKKPQRAQEGNHTYKNRENNNTACYKRNYRQTGNHDRRHQFTKDTGPKIQYGKSIKLISINMRSMCEISKREQLVEHMKRHDIDIAAIQETKIPQAAEEIRKGYILLFSSSVIQGREKWGVGWRYKETLEPYRVQYTLHSSTLAEIEFNMKGNRLVLMTA